MQAAAHRDRFASRPLRGLAFGGLLALAALPARAGNDAYFVTYNHHITKGELELMIMNDLTEPAQFKREEDGQRDYVSNMIELEYGLSDQFATEFMIEAFEESADNSQFTGFRWENRYRLFREDVPLNPVVYTEYEDLDVETRFKMEVSGWAHPPYAESDDEPDRERILESRLLLSEDIGPWNVAFNWINETDTAGGGFTPFGYAMGVRYAAGGAQHGGGAEAQPSASGERHHDAHGPVLGIEWYGGLGDSRQFGIHPSRQEHYMQPLIMLHLKEDVMLHLGLAIGLTKASDNLVRTGLALEF